MDLREPLAKTRRGSRYIMVAEVIREVCWLFSVTKIRNTAYHLQLAGLVERINRTLIDMLAKVSINQPEDWDVHLDRVLLAYQSSVHHTTGSTSCRIIFGRELKLPADMICRLPHGALDVTTGVYVQRLHHELKQLFDTVQAKAGLEQRRQMFWKAKKAHGHVYKPGDHVWLQVPARSVGGRDQLVVHFGRLKPCHDRQQISETWEVGRKRRSTCRPTWLRDFLCKGTVSTEHALHEGGCGVANELEEEQQSYRKQRDT
ncbi:hypothetical protein T06_716 [Trichinella sp. T6]|nr:hypothetical protein T06_716 [Trichinella sp. T6]